MYVHVHRRQLRETANGTRIFRSFMRQSLISFRLFSSLIFFHQFDNGERFRPLNTTLSDVRLRFTVERSMKRSTRKQRHECMTHLSPPFPECYLGVNVRVMTSERKSRPGDVCRSHLTAGWLHMMEATSPQGGFTWNRQGSYLIGMYIIALHALQSSSFGLLLPR